MSGYVDLPPPTDPLDPSSPLDNVEGMTGIRPVDILLGDDAETVNGVTFVADGTPLVNQTATQINTESTVARAEMRFTGGTSDAFDAPNNTFAELDGTRNFGIAYYYKSTDSATRNLLGKRIAVGYEILQDLNGKLFAQYQTDVGSSTTPLTVESYNDGLWHLVFFHVVVTAGSERVVLATKDESMTGTWPGGSAAVAQAFSVGANRVVSVDHISLATLFFLNTPADLNEQKFARELFYGFDPQDPAGHGPVGTVSVQRIA